MTNIYFQDEEITTNDLYFICYMIERVARKLHQKNRYVVNAIGKAELVHLISVANVLHCENPLQVEDDWINEYELKAGDYDVTNVDRELAEIIPTSLEMGKVYQRLISDTLQPGEDYVDGIIRIYNDEICEVIDNYNCSAFYEPSYVIARAYQNGGF
ncbi:MAG: hypothetical protein SOW34_11860 [Oliverpabstia sp.]|nr:hypothetical protein [Eubacterium sp.]MDY2595552.1 hypothetical protein [Oliverpabstia sp.]